MINEFNIYNEKISRKYIQKVAIYCRLSREDKEKINKGDDSESIQNQKLLLMDYAVNKHWQIYKVYSDDDYSGLDRERPQFNEMINEAEKGTFNIIICKNQARFSRDMEIVEKYIHNKFLLLGIRFIGVVDNVDTKVEGGKKSRQINGLVNEWYCEDLSANVKAALTAKKKSGQYLGYWCTYGYELNPNDKHKLVVDPQAAEVVKEIYSLYLKGYGIYSISKILTEKKYLTPSIYKRSKGKKYYNPAKAKYSSQYGIWAVNTVRRILRDKTYLGHLIQGRERKVSYKTKKVVSVPENEWIVVKNNHEPIINDDTFYKVQKRIGVKSSSFKHNSIGELTKPHIFAGKVICMDCKRNLHKNYGYKNTPYLRCGLSVKTSSKKCTPHSIKLEKLTEAVKTKIQNLISIYINDEGNAKRLMENFLNKDDLEKELKKNKAFLFELSKSQERLSMGLANSYMDKVNGVLTEQSFQLVQKDFGIKLKTINEDFTKTEKHIEQLKSKLDFRKKNLFKIEKYIDFKELTYEIVNDFIDYIEIGEKDKDGNQEIEIYWTF